MKTTKHKQTEKSLANAKQLLQEAERLAGMGHWVVYPDTGKLFWSDEIYRIHGFEVGGEIDIEAAINVYHPDDRAKVAEYVRRAIEEKENYDFELRLIRTDGETRYVHSTGVVRLKPNGKVDSVFGVFHDITERKQIEQQLKTINKRMALAADAAGIGIWDLDLINNELIWDDWMFRLYGIKREEFSGAYEAWQQGVHPEDLERSSAEVEQAIHGDKGFDTEFRVVLPNGEVRHIKANAILVKDVDGKPLHMIGTNIDITERKQIEAALQESERRLTDAQRIGKVGSFRLDVVNGLWSGSDMLYPILGVKEKGEHSIDEWVEILHPDHRESLSTYNQYILEQNLPFDKEYMIIRQTDGETRWVHSLGELQFDDSGNLIAMIGTTRDITEAKQAEDELRDAKNNLEIRVEERTRELSLAKKEAEVANHAKSDFLSSMSHELRTPLNAILGFSQLIEMNTEVDKTRDSSQEIINAGNHLLSLISQVLDLSKIESGNIELSIEKCSLNKALNNILTMINPLAEKHSIKIDNKVSTSFNINVDKMRFKQVLLNILSNAIKYNSENGKVIIDCSSDAKNMLCLSISDTGDGLTPEQLSNIFEPFERLGVENSKIEGTGLGLKISKDLIELMGGTITVESTVGKGSSFLICIPLS